MDDLPRPFKVVRTDRELQMPRVDAALREAGAQLVLLPDGTPEDELAREVADADLLLMCYARISRRVIAAAPNAEGHRQVRRGHRRHRHRRRARARHSGGQRAGLCRGDRGRRRVRAADGAVQALQADPPGHADRGLGLARAPLAGRRPVGQDAGPGGAGPHRPQHGAHGRRPSACACWPTTRTWNRRRCRPACSAAMRWTRCWGPATRCRSTAC